jgi:hypothetical protein
MTIRDKQRHEFEQEMYGDDPLEKALDWIRANLRLEDVFEVRELVEWAEDNGFVREED